MCVRVRVRVRVHVRVRACECVKCSLIAHASHRTALSLFVASNAPHPLSPVRRDRISQETSHASENTAADVAQI